MDVEANSHQLMAKAFGRVSHGTFGLPVLWCVCLGLLANTIGMVVAGFCIFGRFELHSYLALICVVGALVPLAGNQSTALKRCRLLFRVTLLCYVAIQFLTHICGFYPLLYPRLIGTKWRIQSIVSAQALEQFRRNVVISEEVTWYGFGKQWAEHEHLVPRELRDFVKGDETVCTVYQEDAQAVKSCWRIRIKVSQLGGSVVSIRVGDCANKPTLLKGELLVRDGLWISYSIVRREPGRVKGLNE